MVEALAIILLVVFAVIIFSVFMQLIAAIFGRRKILKMIDEGYYFLEVQVRWRRKELRPIHPNNVDCSSGIPRLLTPITANVY